MAWDRDVKMDGNIRDRGKIKWTAMMLPEHVKELRQWQEDADKVKRPDLDEFDLQTMQEEVGRALSSGLETRITTWADGYFRYHRGIVHEATTQYVCYEDPFGKHRVAVNEIVAVMLME